MTLKEKLINQTIANGFKPDPFIPNKLITKGGSADFNFTDRVKVSRTDGTELVEGDITFEDLNGLYSGLSEYNE